MKKFVLILCAVILGFLTSSAASLLSTPSPIPDNNSEISAFDFGLKFDLTEVIAQYGEKEYGIGINGFFDPDWPEPDFDMYVALYEGEGDSKIFLDATWNEDVKGNSATFQTGDILRFSFPNQIVTPGKTYTIVITNGFWVFEKGNKTSVSNTYISFLNNPIVLTYKGVGAISDNLMIEETSINNNAKLPLLEDWTVTFNQDISLVHNAKVYLKNEDAILSEVTPEIVNGKSLRVPFGGVTLLNGHDYKLEIPAGIVLSVEDSSKSNAIYSLCIKGAGFNTFGCLTSTPNEGEKGLFNTVEAIFNIPENYKLLTNMGERSNFTASLYMEDIIETNFIETLQGSLGEDGRSINWTLKTRLTPSTKYIVYVPAEQFSAWKNRTIEDYINEEYRLSFFSLSVEEAGFPPIELGDPVIGKHDERGRTLKNGDTVDALNLIEIAPVDYFYKGKDGNSKFQLDEDTNKHKGYLYDITTGTPELIKEVSLSLVQRETSTFYYSVISAQVNTVFFEGHKYRFVIPKDEFTILYPPLYNYVRTPEYSIEFNGTTPTEVNLLSCTLQEGEERSSLGNVIWTFKGQFKLNPEAEAILERTGYKSKRLLTSDISNSGNTNVVAHIYSSLTGDPLPLHNGEEWTLTLPEGALYYQTDPTIKNKEIVVSFKGIDAKPEVQEPEFVNVEVCIEGVHTTTSETVKGRKLTLTLTPDEFWTVGKLLRDKDNVIDKLEDGRYTTPALNADTRIEAVLKCKANVLLNETATSVMEIPDSNVKVYSDGTHIIVEGLNVGDMVAVYTVNGMLITSQEMTTADHNMQITADKGVIYIIRVNDKAVKIQH